jgi:hypothetical protein
MREEEEDGPEKAMRAGIRNGVLSFTLKGRGQLGFLLSLHTFLLDLSCMQLVDLKINKF